METCLLRSKGFRMPADVQGAAKCLRALGGTAEAAVGVAGAEDQDEHLASMERSHPCNKLYQLNWLLFPTLETFSQANIFHLTL